MELDGSLPHLQVPTTCPYREPYHSSACHPTPHPEDPTSDYHSTFALVYMLGTNKSTDEVT